METTKYKIIATTNPYIAQRDIFFNGKTCVTIETDLNLKEAQRKLLDLFNKHYDTCYLNWGLVRCHFPNYTSTRRDGTRRYEYDSRYFSIEVQDEEE